MFLYVSIRDTDSLIRGRSVGGLRILGGKAMEAGCGGICGEGCKYPADI